MAENHIALSQKIINWIIIISNRLGNKGQAGI